MARVLVTGGAGAVGSNLVEALLEMGHDVVVLDDLSSGRHDLVSKRAEFVHGSVVDEDSVAAAFASAPELVVHSAALFANQNSVDHPQEDLRVNGMGTMNVLLHATRADVKKVLFSSSSCVYGNRDVMSEDDLSYELDTPYAITKLLGEHYCRYWSEQHGLNVVTVRLFNSYGPNEYPGRYRNVIPNFFHTAIRGRPLPITGTGEETRDFTYVGDIVDGMIKALFENTSPGSVFNLGSGVGTRIVELAQKINELSGNDAGLEFLPPRPWDHVKTRVADITRARTVLGFEPTTTLNDGLEATYRWLKDADE